MFHYQKINCCCFPLGVGYIEHRAHKLMGCRDEKINHEKTHDRDLLWLDSGSKQCEVEGNNHNIYSAVKVYSTWPCRCSRKMRFDDLALEWDRAHKI